MATRHRNMINATKKILDLLGSGIELSVVNATDLPTPVRVPVLGEGVVSLYIGALGVAMTTSLTPRVSVLTSLDDDMKRMDLDSTAKGTHGIARSLLLSDGEILEAEAHRLRMEATIQGSIEKFQQAIAKYEQALLLNDCGMIESIKKSLATGKNYVSIRLDCSDRVKLGMLSMHRHLSHCFAGMALCELMGARSPEAFFNLTSSALVWEREGSLQLVNFMRLHFLLMGLNYPQFKFTPVLDEFNKRLVRPVVLAERESRFLEVEKSISDQKEWAKALASLEEKRIEEVRNLVAGILNGANPINLVAVRNSQAIDFDVKKTKKRQRK